MYKAACVPWMYKSAEIIFLVCALPSEFPQHIDTSFPPKRSISVGVFGFLYDFGFVSELAFSCHEICLSKCVTFKLSNKDVAGSADLERDLLRFFLHICSSTKFPKLENLPDLSFSGKYCSRS